jgi:hypothetical protein
VAARRYALPHDVSATMKGHRMKGSHPHSFEGSNPQFTTGGYIELGCFHDYVFVLTWSLSV